tara:strand:- start:1247 stop:1447 length:201 start_codon:yes stop_codon:yes gene_type:complete
MTQDFVEDAIEACNREKVPFVFAMRSGQEGEWLVSYNLTHYSPATNDKKQEVCDLIALSLGNEREP